MSDATTKSRQIILFDGLCAVCDSLVLWILARDPHGRFHYAPLQGETAQVLRNRHPEIPEGVHTIVLVQEQSSQEEVILGSRAVFKILAQLETPWRAAALFRWLPRWLTDLGYQTFVQTRYRMFGRRDLCRVPNADQGTRFLP